MIAWAAAISEFSTARFSSASTAPAFNGFLSFFWRGLSPETMELLHHLARKFGHVGEYFVLSLLLFRALRAGREERWRPAWFWICVMGVAAYAGFDELHQGFVPGREARLGDVGLDSLGGLLGQTLIRARRRRISA